MIEITIIPFPSTGIWRGDVSSRFMSLSFICLPLEPLSLVALCGSSCTWLSLVPSIPPYGLGSRPVEDLWDGTSAAAPPAVCMPLKRGRKHVYPFSAAKMEARKRFGILVLGSRLQAVVSPMIDRYFAMHTISLTLTPDRAEFLRLLVRVVSIERSRLGIER